MPPDEPNQEEKLEKLPEDYDTPFRPAPTRKVSGLSTYPATDTDIDQSEIYHDGLPNAAGINNLPNGNHVVQGYDPSKDQRLKR